MGKSSLHGDCQLLFLITGYYLQVSGEIALPGVMNWIGFVAMISRGCVPVTWLSWFIMVHNG